MSRKQFLITILALFILSGFGFFAGIYVGKNRGIPFMSSLEDWSIGIYVGDSPLSLVEPDGVRNPVLTSWDISDIQAKFVADPFMISDNGKWYMFFEALNKISYHGDIGLATSQDGFRWRYEGIVLDEPFHLSYPCVFKWQGEYYMVPETFQAGEVRLYKAEAFPFGWKFQKTLIKEKLLVDPSIFTHGDKWWLFASTAQNDILFLYYADELTGPWKEHPQSPVIKDDASRARPGGRVISFQDRLIRFAQDDSRSYGEQVRAFQILTLTATSFEEKEVGHQPVLRPKGSGWNGSKMHHIDAHLTENGRWVACVDGVGRARLFGWKY